MPESESDLAPLLEQAAAALRADDAERLRALLRRHPELAARVDEPLGAFDSPAILHARSREILDVLLEAGADINARSRWWAGGFGLLDSASPELAAYAIERGAVVDVHAAARLGMGERLRRMLADDPQAIHSRGGDGQTPLHFACDIEIAELLLAHGADIDARDLDHQSTPAQWMLDERRDVARYLVGRGCWTDLLMAAALGDVDLARRHLDADPTCIRTRVSEEFFPMIGGRNGGTIYQWTLGWYVTAHAVARERGHTDMLELLDERTPTDLRLIEACWSGDDGAARAILAERPGIIEHLSAADRRHVAHAARNDETAAVRLMLECGWPVDATGQHEGTPLHWAAFHGNAAMVEAVLAHDPPLEARDADFAGTPMSWALHGSLHGWKSSTGDYAATVEALLRAGAAPPADPGGSAAAQDVLRRHALRDPAPE